MSDVLRIANCSGFFGDRLSAARELVEGGDIDVLTGDYLAEITMLILARQRLRDPKRGYVSTFITQMREVLGQCLERGIKVVVNAGGLNPGGCRDALAEEASSLGLAPNIAVVEGDDLLPRLAELQASDWAFPHLDTGDGLGSRTVITANAYLGSWGIVEALRAGADVVVTGRVTDSALVLGPAMWRFDWDVDDWDRLAAGIVAGHLIECSTQVTGGNYAFYREVPELHDIGMPIAEMEASGEFVLTKHPDTGGLLSTETVIAQLLYEIGSPAYLTPDVTAHFNSVAISQAGSDRVRITGARGAPPPEHLKAVLHYPDGFRNHVDVVIGGQDADRKTEIAEALFWKRAGTKEAYQETRTDRFSGPGDTRYVRISARSPDPGLVGRAFSNAAVELALASVPGITLGAPPRDATPCGRIWPTTVPRDAVTTTVSIGGKQREMPCPAVPTSDGLPSTGESLPQPVPVQGPMIGRTLGELCGARSGDKGADANLGLWARKPESYEWMRFALSPDWLRGCLPEPFEGPIHRYELPNISALNFVLKGYLGDGAAASIRLDSQAKLLGEQVRAVMVNAPVDRQP